MIRHSIAKQRGGYQVGNSRLFDDSFSTGGTFFSLLEPVNETLPISITQLTLARWYRIAKDVATRKVEWLIKQLCADTTTNPLL
jgi:hypothetical protein